MNAGVADNPVFLVGAVRSGTTLLRLMLRQHPQIAHGKEFEYGVAFCDGDRLLSPDQYRQALSVHRAFQDENLHVDPQLSTAQLVRSFLEQVVEPQHRIVLPVVHSHFDRVPKLWPDARYIHLIRDPRDVSRSCIGMGWVGTVWHGAKVWIDAEQRWDRLRTQLRDDQFMELHFEQLLENPKQSLERICEFLGIEYSDRMLEYHSNSTYGPPDANLAWQWKQKLSPREIEHVESRCRGLMEPRGYACVTDARAAPAAERLRLWWANRTYRVRQNSRKYGVGLYVKWQLCRKVGLAHSGWGRRVVGQVHDVDRKHLK